MYYTFLFVTSILFFNLIKQKRIHCCPHPVEYLSAVFERYVYDYLVKRNMYQTAETFKNETNLQLDPNVASTIDVPEGFLLEWWSFNYDFDFFRAWVEKQEKHGLEAAQGCHASQQAECSMNAEVKNQLPYNFTSVMGDIFKSQRMVTGELPFLSLPSSHHGVSGDLSQLFLPSSHQEASGELSQLFLPSSQQEVSGEFPQLFLPSSHQEELQTSPPRTTNVAKTNGKEVEHFVPNTSKAECAALSEETDPMIENLLNSFWMFEPDQLDLFDKPTLGESSKQMNNLQAGGEGDIAMNDFADFTSPALNDDDNKSETSDCSSHFRIITSDADAVMAPQPESNKET
ncbi:hypothetical protein VNO77_43245 [Canavalia gladiata]|uniref:LisH domain-containing protein n=1 Tax=Canavalia gladiata TaxID=3824 RepID=A0AAN9JTQ1_CANGL